MPMSMGGVPHVIFYKHNHPCGCWPHMCGVWGSTGLCYSVANLKLFYTKFGAKFPEKGHVHHWHQCFIIKAKHIMVTVLPAFIPVPLPPCCTPTPQITHPPTAYKAAQPRPEKRCVKWLEPPSTKYCKTRKFHLQSNFAIFTDEANPWKLNAAKIFILLMI